MSLVSNNGNHDVCYFIGVRRTSISLLISAGLSHEAVAALSNKAPGSLRDYVEPSIHDKQPCEGKLLIVRFSRFKHLLF